MSNNTNSVTIIREHDKLCILEKWINGDSELENFVSKYIDYCIQNDDNNKKIYVYQIINKINDITLLAKIIKLSESIAFQTPYQINVDNISEYNNLIQYLNQPFVPFISNYSLPAFS